MDRHLPVPDHQSTLSVVSLIDTEHAAVSRKSGRVDPVFERRACFFGCRCPREIRLRLQRISGVGDIERFHIRDPAQTGDLAVNGLKASVCCEHTLPGIRLITGHVVVCVVACHDHQGAENDLFVPCRLHFFNDLLAGSLLRLALDRADEYICVPECIHLGLHLAVGHLREMGGAVSHKYESGALRCRGFQAFEAAVRHCLPDDCLSDRRLVIVDSCRVLPDFSQKGLRNMHSIKIPCGGCHGRHEIIVLRAVHEVGRLYDQVLYAVCFGAGECLVHVVDGLAVARLHVVDDDLGSKGPADSPVGISFLEGFFNPPDIHRAALVEGRAEADDEQLVVADPIAVAGIIQGRIAGIAAEIVRVRLLAFHQFLLGICQGIPGGSGRSDVRIRGVCAFLYIDRIDQGRAFRRKLLVRFCSLRCGCCRRCCCSGHGTACHACLLPPVTGFSGCVLFPACVLLPGRSRRGRVCAGAFGAAAAARQKRAA